MHSPGGIREPAPVPGVTEPETEGLGLTVLDTGLVLTLPVTLGTRETEDLTFSVELVGETVTQGG